MKNLLAIIILFFALFGNIESVNAQFWKNLGKRATEAAKETVKQKVENKASEKTGEVMDTILNSDKKIKKIAKHKKRRKKNKAAKHAENKGTDVPSSKNVVNSKKDFVPGANAIYTDTFKNDAIGDFPVTWNTNSSGEVITFNDDNTKWLQLDLGQYTPDGITKIPENCTFEFDLSVSDNFDWYSDGITLNIVAVKDRRKDFTKWARFSAGANGVRLRLKPKNFEYVGETAIQIYQDNDKTIENTKNNKQFTLENNKVHVHFGDKKTDCEFT